MRRIAAAAGVFANFRVAKGGRVASLAGWIGGAGG
jgi:hypothetical protein